MNMEEPGGFGRKGIERRSLVSRLEGVVRIPANKVSTTRHRFVKENGELVDILGKMEGGANEIIFLLAGGTTTRPYAYKKKAEYEKVDTVPVVEKTDE